MNGLVIVFINNVTNDSEVQILAYRGCYPWTVMYTYSRNQMQQPQKICLMSEPCTKDFCNGVIIGIPKETRKMIDNRFLCSDNNWNNDTDMPNNVSNISAIFP